MLYLSRVLLVYLLDLPATLMEINVGIVDVCHVDASLYTHCPILGHTEIGWTLGAPLSPDTIRSPYTPSPNPKNTGRPNGHVPKLPLEFQ